MIVKGTYKQTMRRKQHGAKVLKVHRLIVEDLLGKQLPREVEIHHIDGNKSNNVNNNLVVCPSRSYHQLLHRRQEAFDAGYNPDTYHKCTDCKDFLAIEGFSKNKTRASGYNNLCKGCDSLRQKERYRRKK